MFESTAWSGRYEPKVYTLVPEAQSEAKLVIGPPPCVYDILEPFTYNEDC